MTDQQEFSLRNIKMFKDVPEETLAIMEERCGWKTYAPHEQIIDRQSDSRDVYFITRGRARVVNYSASGREISFDDIGDGAVFGELAAIDGEPRSANVVALTQTTVATLSPKAFHEVLEECPSVAMSLMQRLAHIIRISVDRIMDLSTLGAHNRVYAELLRLARDRRIDNNQAEITPVPIHSDIASRVSTTRETVARVFGELTKKGLVERKGNTLVVTDMDRLQEMVEEFRGD
ncbi:Crp/Fnr family transcriptional regulator [Aestuariispira insulae]|uniref:CRP-like cAMP-binding protein n=1 Tax=Aestuariispira insulae TaxID=1461337 RepID=A0A3D9HNL8_9PROT|nr:Crp/Fnr family transcriptional regulator [Aestuariispira insulae]RED51068.1 CRP-like cAMP-binding protein [Aestuariispira insulae]